MNEKEPTQIQLPFDDDVLDSLRAGDAVRFSGVIHTALDHAHRELAHAIERDEELPFDPNGQVIYYSGPAPASPGTILGPAGPTTAARMDPYAPLLIKRGLAGIIAKGRRSPEVVEILKEHRCIYFAAIEGTAALLSSRVREASVIAYPELGAQAMHRLVVEDFPLVVANDLHGGDIYRHNIPEWRELAKKHIAERDNSER